MVEIRTIKITGIVQGIGCRPRIKWLANQYQLYGYVLNQGNGVILEVEGHAQAIESFLQEVQDFLQQVSGGEAGAMHESCRLHSEHTRYKTFEIRESSQSGIMTTQDTALCSDCLQELLLPTNRRYLYPFISCALCGPRYAISRGAPFDRQRTSLDTFPMCAACLQEYQAINDRRFHAQTISCPDCGPRLSLLDADGKPLDASTWQDQSVLTLRRGGVIAVKTSGGFHLLALANHTQAIARLRQIKHRPRKPLALLVPDISWVERHCELNLSQKQLLESRAAPLVLLRALSANQKSVSDLVAPDNPYLAVMLPHHPIQYLLLQGLQLPVVATSANLSGDTLIADEAALLASFSGQLDLIVSHNLEIEHPMDDSIFQWVAGQAMCLRAGRGVAPLRLAVPEPFSRQSLILAMGAELKNAPAISIDQQILVAPYQGDVSAISTLERQQKTLAYFQQGINQHFNLVITDTHPQSQQAVLPFSIQQQLSVQHHLAHARASQWSIGVTQRHLAVVWDGFGYGDSNNSMWGGECFLMEGKQSQLLAHFQEMALLGADVAMREPRRMALAALWPLLGEDSFQQLASIWGKPIFTPQEQQIFYHQLSEQNYSTTRAVGRLFDAVASLLHLLNINDHEGHGAMQVQFTAEDYVRHKRETVVPYHLPITGQGAPFLIDTLPLLKALVFDQKSIQHRAYRFHLSLAQLVVELAEKSAVSLVTLSGGCFQNALLVQLCQQMLAARSIDCRWSPTVPLNDGGIALGQLAEVLINWDEYQTTGPSCA